MFLICVNTLFPVFLPLCSLSILLPALFLPLLISFFLFLAGFSRSVEFFLMWVYPKEMELLVEYIPAMSATRVLILKRRHTGPRDTLSRSPKALQHPNTLGWRRCLKPVITQEFSAHRLSIVINSSSVSLH